MVNMMKRNAELGNRFTFLVILLRAGIGNISIITGCNKDKICGTKGP